MTKDLKLTKIKLAVTILPRVILLLHNKRQRALQKRLEVNFAALAAGSLLRMTHGRLCDAAFGKQGRRNVSADEGTYFRKDI